MEAAVKAFYGACDLVLSPSAASDAALAAAGTDAARILRWDRGVDTARFDPAAGDEPRVPGAFTVMYTGRISSEKGIDLLVEALLAARAREPRVRAVFAGGGPEEERVQAALGDAATFLGWLEGDALPRAYASADAFLFPSATDTFGQVVLEAQASGLPVVAIARGGPLSLIEHRVSGLLCEPNAGDVADALVELARSPLLCTRLSAAGLAAARARTWEGALSRLAEGYELLLSGAGSSPLAGSPTEGTRAA
jgi:glycosyltransferase involved in cell wall biosynthesis